MVMSPVNLWKLACGKQQIMSDGGFKSSFICRYKMVAVHIMDKLVYCSVFALDIVLCPFISIERFALELLAVIMNATAGAND